MKHWNTAAKIAWRETRASSGRFLFVVLAVAAGVGSLPGVRGFSRAFHTRCCSATPAASWRPTLASALLPYPDPNRRAWDYLAGEGIRMTHGHRDAHHGRPPKGGVPLLISVKAVDPAVYPFYGTGEVRAAA